MGGQASSGSSEEGSEASHKGGFASMDPEKQVSSPTSSYPVDSITGRVADDERHYRRKLRPWAVRLRADRLRKVVRRPRRPGRRADLLPEKGIGGQERR